MVLQILTEKNKGINLVELQRLAEKHKISKIDKQILVENGLASKNELIKILGKGELKAKLEVTADAFSKTAQSAIEAVEGTVNII